VPDFLARDVGRSLVIELWVGLREFRVGTMGQEITLDTKDTGGIDERDDDRRWEVRLIEPLGRTQGGNQGSSACGQRAG